MPAIASDEVGQSREELDVLVEEFNDKAPNKTTFIHFMRDDNEGLLLPSAFDRTTCHITIPDERGSLGMTLMSLAVEGINLARIDASMGRLNSVEGSVVVSVDMDASWDEEKTARARGRLERMGITIKNIGSYTLASTLAV